MVAWLIEDAANWLYDTLEPDTALRTALGGAGRVFDGMPPQGTSANPVPDRYVSFWHASGIPVVCQGPTRPGEDTVWGVKVVGRAKSFRSLTSALNRIEALLFGADVTVGSVRLQVVERPGVSRTLRQEDLTPGGTIERHAGRFWPLSIYAA